MLINTFAYSNFNFCQLIWHFSTQNLKNSKKLRLLLNEHTKNYLQLLKISEYWEEKIKILGKEIFETLNGLNLDFIKDIFYYRS